MALCPASGPGFGFVREEEDGGDDPCMAEAECVGGNAEEEGIIRSPCCEP